MMLTRARIDHRAQAIRLLAMSICAETPGREARLLKLSQDAQHEAGIMLMPEDPEVVELVAQFRKEDKEDWDALHAPEDSEARCPRRE